MYQNNLPPNHDQPSRVDATEFSDNDQLDLHASTLAAAREAIAQATRIEQVQELQFIQELRSEGLELKRFRKEYDANTINLHEDENDQTASYLSKDKFDLAA